MDFRRRLWLIRGFALFRRYVAFLHISCADVDRMASVMLIVLATAREASLRSCLPANVTEIGPHLGKYLTQWMRVPGHGVSPSVMQSIRLIEDASVSLQDILDA